MEATPFVLTKENYFSEEANWKYMGSSQYKSFRNCEAQAMASLKGEWERKTTDSMLQGKYVHAWNENVLPEFKKQNNCETDLSIKAIFESLTDEQVSILAKAFPKAFNDKSQLKKGMKKDDFLAMLNSKKETKDTVISKLKSEFETAGNVIRVIKGDPAFMKSLEGEKEVIFTAMLFGMPWKILIDVYNKEKRRITDLKILKGLYDKFWVHGERLPENVFEHFGYYNQIAIYPEIERLANGREDYFEPFISVATKEKYPNIEIIHFGSKDQPYDCFIKNRLFLIETYMPRIKDVKEGKEEPIRCEICDYCRSTKKISRTTHFSDFEI